MIEYFNEDCLVGMAIDTTDISAADLAIWGVSSLVMMVLVLGAIGMRAEE